MNRFVKIMICSWITYKEKWVEFEYIVYYEYLVQLITRPSFKLGHIKLENEIWDFST